MRTLTQHRMLSFSAAAAAFLAIPSGLNGQIAYTNFDPDLVLDPDTDPWPHADYLYNYLDMNADGITDFTIMAFGTLSYSGWLTSNYYSNRALISPADKQAFAGYGMPGGYYYASIIDYGQTINDLMAWVEDETPAEVKTAELKRFYHTPATILESGNWGDQNGKFVAVRLRSPGTKYYGWIRMSVSEKGDSITIHDFAYNTVSNAPINAGETGIACAPPFPYITQVLSPTQVKVKWQQTANAANYRIRYREVGAASWITAKASATKSSKILSGLTCGTTYEWQIRETCIDGTISEYSDMQYFTPQSCRLAEEALPVTQVELFPNPTSGMLYVDVDGFSMDMVEALVIDMEGRVLRSFALDQQEISVISVDDLPVGNYFIRVSDQVNVQSARFIVVE